MADVTFSQVAKRYGNLSIIEGLDLEIRDREFMVLVGPSGCGKSTALRMIAGLEEVSGGTISIGGRPVNDLPPKDRDIAMVFQNYALYPHMTVGENLEFGLKMRKRPKEEIERLVREAAELLEIGHLLERKPRALSGGQRQRVALGRAIVRKPAVFLFDEPLSNLDAKLRTQMRAELKKLHQRLQTTTVYVTHDQTEAMTMGQRIALMKEGKIQQVGAPLTIYDKPENLFVASFVGSPPMNLFPAILKDGGATVAATGFTLSVPERLRAATAAKDGRRVVVGIRPESFRASASAKDGALLRASVEVVEPLGDEVIVHARIGEERLVAKLDPEHIPEPGERLEFSVDIDRLHLFDAETELRLVA